ncbi:MAG: RING finger protein [Armatimonadota bacterium]
MLCPACRRNIRPQGRFCPLCGAQVFGRRIGSDPFGPPVSPPEPGYPHDPRLANVHPPSPVTPPVVDGAYYRGKTCPFCQFVVKPGDRVVVCPHCDIPHHLDCWSENGGCTTFGCAGASEPSPTPSAGAPLGAGAALGPPGSYGYTRPPPPPYAGGPYAQPFPPLDDPFRLAKAERTATNALWCSILGLCCGVLSILGIIFGAMAIGELNRMGIGSHPVRSRAVAAIIIGAVLLVVNVLGSVVGGISDSY